MNSVKNNRKTVVLSTLAVSILVAVFYYFYTPSYNWYDHSYQDTDDEPYNIDLTKAYLKSLRPLDEFHMADSSIAQNLKPILNEKGLNYIVFGYMPFLDSLDLVSMISFAKNGNSVFLFSEVFDSRFIEELHRSECVLYEHEFYDGTKYPYFIKLPEVDMRMSDKRLQMGDPQHFVHYVKNEKKDFSWYYLDEDYFCDKNTSFQELGTMNGHVNYARASIGSGNIYLHTSPIALSNFYLLNDKNRAYADKVFAYLEEGGVYWDSKLWLAEKVKVPMNGSKYGHDEGPLAYLLSQESFRWALALIFTATVLFLLIGTRRNQRSIPILASQENSSLQYVDTLTGLYYAQRSDGRIFKFLSDQFLFFVRERYRIHVSWEEENDWPLLSKASGIPLAHLKYIKELKAKGSYEPNVNGDILADFYQKLELFYSECK